MELITSSYNYYWVIFSILIGILFSYVAIDLRWKLIVFKEFMYNAWLLGCAVTMGLGIWTMHFVGMLAMEMAIPVVYDTRIVLLSMLVSIVVTGISFLFMRPSYLRLVLSSIIMGGGIVCMHYLGVSAMKINFSIIYHPSYICLSIIIAIVASLGALWLLFFFKNNQITNIKSRIFSSILMGIGIAGMHYVGMFGTDFLVKTSPTLIPSIYTVSSDLISSFISLPIIIVLFIMFLSGAFLDKKLLFQTKELRERDKKLQESEKLTLIGELASGVAHEIRNPLTSLKGFTKIIHDDLDGGSNRGYLKIMMDEIDRINFIVSEFMVLSKPHLVNFALTDLSKIITDVITLLNTQAIMKNIEIVPEINGKSVMLKCEENQIKQVLVNIIKNAIEATSEGGTIFVKLEKRATIVSVSIIDHGIGIPEENINLLGKPFYTTKSEGTGLGIMISKKIIQNHNGEFKIVSEPNKGTKVSISLPIECHHLNQVKQNSLINKTS